MLSRLICTHGVITRQAHCRKRSHIWPIINQICIRLLELPKIEESMIDGWFNPMSAITHPVGEFLPDPRVPAVRRYLEAATYVEHGV